MLQDVVHPPPPPEQLPIDEISSPLSAQIFELCDPAELFPETLQNSEVTSCSNCCYEDLENNKFNGYQDNTGTTTTAAADAAITTTATTTTTNNSINSSNLSIIFDSQDEIDNDISASIDFSPFSAAPIFFSAQQQDQFDLISSMQQQPQILSADIMGPPLQPVFEEDCLSSVPSYLPLNPPSPSCSFLGAAAMGSYMASGALNAALSAESSGINFPASILLGSELQPQELEFQGDNGGIFYPDSLQRVFNSGDLQALSNESPNMVGGAGNSTTLTSEISDLEDSAFKVGKLSVEQRKEKIHRYMKKRNERNFSKKIKYACRKTLADSRPRVRGRFAKNDDFGENPRPASSHHEDDDEDDVVVVKEEDDMVDSSDIFAHISGVNSFKCNYPIQSWI